MQLLYAPFGARTELNSSCNIIVCGTMMNASPSDAGDSQEYIMRVIVYARNLFASVSKTH